MAKKLTVWFALMLVVSPIFAVLSFAQVDPEKALVGRWEGQAEVAKNRERKITINSVKATGSGEWVGYATTAGANTEVSISKKDNEIYLEWASETGSKAPYHMKLVDESKMEGTVESFQRGRVAPARVTFEKIKAGDVK